MQHNYKPKLKTFLGPLQGQGLLLLIADKGRPSRCYTVYNRYVDVALIHTLEFFQSKLGFALAVKSPGNWYNHKQGLRKMGLSFCL